MSVQQQKFGSVLFRLRRVDPVSVQITDKSFRVHGFGLDLDCALLDGQLFKIWSMNKGGVIDRLRNWYFICQSQY